MRSNERHQGGWAASFIIVGAVLVLGLVGGVYYLKQQSDAGQDKAPVAVTTPDESSNQQNDDTDQRNEENKAEQSAGGTLPGTQQQPLTTTPSPSSDSAARLPETGPSDTFDKLFAVTSLTVAGVIYLQSRRQASSL